MPPYPFMDLRFSSLSNTAPAGALKILEIIAPLW